jgi:ABC-type multidrug transport system ATPase subunit
MYRKPTFITIGTGRACDIVVEATPIAGTVKLEFAGTLVLRVESKEAVRFDGRLLPAGWVGPIDGYAHEISFGDGFVDLHHPKLALLFTQPLHALTGDRPYLLGSDRLEVDVHVDHPTVSDQHARIDLVASTITDLGGQSGTRLGFRAGRMVRPGPLLEPNEPTSFAECEGVFLGGAWLPVTVLRGEPWVAARSADPQAVVARVDGATIRIGRSPDCQLHIPSPLVSKEHAEVTRRPDGRLAVRDLGSTNGTFVRGRRLRRGEVVVMDPTERLLVGPYPVRLDGSEGPQAQGSGQIEIEAAELTLEVPDRADRKAKVVLLDGVSFKALPGDCIALMGPSGAGKTTLLTTLLGSRRPTSGHVKMNGEDIAVIFDALRGSIGYVPQDDLVHSELTVAEAIRYSAKLRLPPDFSAEEIEQRVDETIRDLGLERIRDREIGKPEKKILSGGERKRVNIAVELVTDPPVIFLDEPTSGLAADDTARLVALLKRLATAKGKTIVATIHQPAKEEYETFNYAMILGVGGLVVYFGPTGSSSYSFFDRTSGTGPGTRAIDNPRAMFEAMATRVTALAKAGGSEMEAKRAAARAWHEDFFRGQHPAYALGYGGARRIQQSTAGPIPRRPKPQRVRQLRLLIQRYFTIKWRDWAATLLLLVQAPLIGALVLLIFHHEPPGESAQAVTSGQCSAEELARARGDDPLPCIFLASHRSPAESEMCNGINNTHEDLTAAMAQQDRQCRGFDQCLSSEQDKNNEPGKNVLLRTVNDQTRAIYFMVIAAFWFGISNAAREIVSEQAIFRRERLVNLSIFNYLMSKFVVLAALGLLQCIILLCLTYWGLGMSAPFWTMLGFFSLATLCATAIGLLVSALFRSQEAAVASTPIVLIPQVLLGGGVIETTHSEVVRWLSFGIPARWAFEGAIWAERSAAKACWSQIAPLVNCRAPARDALVCATEQVTSSEIGLRGLGFSTAPSPFIAALVLTGMTLTSLAVIAGLLGRRDRI